MVHVGVITLEQSDQSLLCLNEETLQPWLSKVASEDSSLTTHMGAHVGRHIF